MPRRFHGHHPSDLPKAAALAIPLRRLCFGSLASTSLPRATAFGFFSNLDLARGDSRDHDGCADHVGGALLISGAFGHIESIEEKRRGQFRLEPQEIRLAVARVQLAS